MHSFLFCIFVCFSEVPCVFYQIRKKCMNLYTQNMIVRYFTRFKWIWFLYKCTLIVEWLTFKIKGAFLEFKTTNVFQHRRTCVCLFVRLFSSRSRMFLLIVRRHNYRWRGLKVKMIQMRSKAHIARLLSSSFYHEKVSTKQSFWTLLCEKWSEIVLRVMIYL